MDVDDGPWQDLAAAFPPHAVIPSRKLWRRHLYYSDTEPRANAQKRNLHGCHVDVRSASGYVALWQPEAVQRAAESPRQGDLFPWWTIWPEKGAQAPPNPPGPPPPPPPEGAPRDGPLSDAYPGTRWHRLLEVVKAWAYVHAREYSDRDTFHFALREVAQGRAQEMPDLTDFWDRSTNDPAKAAFYVEDHAWRMWRPIHANNRRWHGDSNYDLERRDAAILTMRAQGVSQGAMGEFHGITQKQVSVRLRGGGGETKGYRRYISVTCRSCSAVFSAVRTSALYCGARCRKRAARSLK